MKKIVLALTLMATPLTIQAQEQKQEVSDHIIQEAVKEFVPAFCNGKNGKKGFDGFAMAVAQCYLSTNDNNPEIEKCMLGDITLMTIINTIRKKDNKLGIDDPTKDITFINHESWEKRFDQYFYPFYLKVTKNVSNYFNPGEAKLTDEIVKNCGH